MSSRCGPARKRNKSRSTRSRRPQVSRKLSRGGTASCYAIIGGSDEQKCGPALSPKQDCSDGIFDEAYAAMTDTSGPIVGAAKRFACTACVFAKTWFRWQKSDTCFSFVIRMLMGVIVLAFVIKYCMSHDKLVRSYYNKLTWYMAGMSFT